MKKKYILLSLTVLAGLSLAACGLVGSRKAQQSSSSSSRKVSLKDSSSSKSSKKRKKEEKTTGTQRVGSADYGYISIPDNWIKFTDLAGGDSVQFTDGSAYNIVTMNAYTKEKANVPENEELTAEDIANRIAYHWHDNSDVDKFWGAKSTVAGHEAFQINIILKSGQYMTVWVFKDGEKVYMLSFEGDKETLMDFVDYIEKTWSLQEEAASTNI